MPILLWLLGIPIPIIILLVLARPLITKPVQRSRDCGVGGRVLSERASGT